MSETRPETMPDGDVVDLLLRQHALIRETFGEVQAATGGDRREAFDRLVRLLAVHETAEEEVVHPFARRTIEGGEEVVYERLREEREAKKLLVSLEGVGPDAPEFPVLFDRLRVAVLAHAQAEERDELVRLRAQTSPDERKAMAVGVKAAEALAPTHPHPGTETVTENVVAGPLLAIMDRTRDVIRQAIESVR
jgi:hypothetical protein